TEPAAAGPGDTYAITPEQISIIPEAGELTTIHYLENARIFAGKSENVPNLQAVLVSNGGVLKTIDWSAIDLPDFMMMAASPNAQRFAWYRFIDQYQVGLWLGDEKSSTLTQVFPYPVDDALWSPDSRGLFFISDRFNDVTVNYTQGVFFTSLEYQTTALLKDISPNEYARLIGFSSK
ncbi:MAG TPA: hypothetical protein VJ965_08565, partial [Anaerolineales bacterium]|nr:hypothetical protein [Anaerolineales bacterium]